MTPDPSDPRRIELHGERAAAAMLEDSYELSPMQQGMLFDTIGAPRSGMYCNVVSYRLSGPLDAAALVDAWRTVVARHPVLRTSFHWEDRKEPVQAVHRTVALSAVEEDWRQLDADEQERRLAALLESENRRGFEVTVAPLIRLFLIRCADDVHELVVTHHHLLLDGSCKPLLFSEVFTAYDAACRGEAVDWPPPAPYRRFIEWLREQDVREAETFWREELSGFTEPAARWPAAPAAGVRGRDYVEYGFDLGEEASDDLRQFARSSRLTLNTVVSGAWALLVGHVQRRTDVVFGATVNGRPPTLEGAESMLGLFINTLPVRAQIAPAKTVSEWLRHAQIRQMRSREFDFAPLTLVQRWSDVPRGQPLFDSILVFENNPGYGADLERHGDVEITNARAVIRNSLPLTLRCVPRRSLSLQLMYDTRRFAAHTVESMATGMVRLLREMPASRDAPLAQLLSSLDAAERSHTAVKVRTFQQAARDRLSQHTRNRLRPEASER